MPGRPVASASRRAEPRRHRGRYGCEETSDSVTLFYNADCPDCARQAKRTAWLSRVRISADGSPIGPVPRGEIVVTDNESQRVFTGVYATSAVCMQVPAYLPYGLVLHIPPLRRILGRDKQGCNGDACEI